MNSDNYIYKQFSELASPVLSEDKIERMRPFFDNLKDEFEETFEFTKLQKEAISSSDFWENANHKLVLGSTSSGKTLVAEMNMAYQIYCCEKKVLYLVPLKALTTEKQKSFEKHFKGRDIYISSSDYQEQDYELCNGNYDIGILVYEKLFALLAQNNSRFLSSCSLIIIDELHMLSMEERGPRLEFSLEKVRFKRSNPPDYPAFMGLTTSECNASRVNKWWGEENTQIIQSDHRPIEIEERFVYCDFTMDKLEMRCFINGEEIKSAEFPVNPRYNVDELEFFQLCQVLEQHPEEHIIIHYPQLNRIKDLTFCCDEIWIFLDSHIFGICRHPDEWVQQISGFQ